MVSKAYRTREIILKKQVKAEDRNFISNFGETSSIILYFVILSYFLAANILGLKMNNVFKLMNTLQIIFFMSLIKLQFPSNAVFLNNILIQVMTFDIIEPYDVLDWFRYDYNRDFNRVNYLNNRGIPNSLTQ